MDKYFIRDFFIFFTYFVAIWCGICIEKRSNELIYENNYPVLDDSNELYSFECPFGTDNCLLEYGIKPCDRRGQGVARANNGKCEDLGSGYVSSGYCSPGTDFKDCCEGIGIRKNTKNNENALCDEKAYQLEQLRIHLSEKDSKICCLNDSVK